MFFERQFDEKRSINKKCFPLRISSVNVAKSAGNCEFDHISWRNP